ncbi:carbohydrate-binding protein [Streptomyces rectiverticillatus]|uniref:carbohydrate-binding protein n=1 Tax=Streptomyces rectiverticillatus TaxID=173860 RepID=UPI0015C3434C|nr:carbohydrate-binding protein [Streptomyces rectiverticillatus]QLE73447.1 carbohydrate-binding protein [Streptomyces rectiverticillatus]
MTAGNNGTGTPESDDPFAHLYRSEGGEGPHDNAPAAPQPGVPRTSYNQVRTVGSRQYGPRQPQPPHAQQPAPHYAAPETLPGGVPRQPASHGGHGGHGGGSRPKRTGLLVAAIAVVAVVAGGIAVAMLNNSGTSDDTSTQAASGGDEKPSSEPKAKDPDKKNEPKNPSAAGLQKRDAASLRLLNGATTSKDIPNAKSDGGLYITNLNSPGAGVEWEVEVKSAGQYRLDVTYGVPGRDGNLTVAANDAPGRSIRMDNFGGTSEEDWKKGYGWKSTWSLIDLKKGKNKIKLSCESGNKCEVSLDQLSVRPQ